MSITLTVVDDVITETERADAKFGGQYDVPDGTGSYSQEVDSLIARQRCQVQFADGEGTWSDILSEEVAEALAESDPVFLRAELLQVAAVAMRWIDAIDERGAES